MNGSMARRLLILLSGAGAGLYPVFSYALGLGELQVESRLNQPLRARIEVSDVGDEEWRRLRAHLGSQQSTADGLSRPGLLESLTFKNVEDENHRRFIEVKSSEVFTEPLFDLSIDVTGVDADVTRNFTVFLDPPGPNDDLPGAHGPMLASRPAATAGTAPRAGSAHAGPATQAIASVRREPGMVVHPAHRKTSAPSAASGGTAASAPASVAADNTSTTSYTVSKSDTLGKIARRFGGATVASRNQFMDWVFQHNSAAFYGDVNRLRAGARLALPENAATAGAQATVGSGGASAKSAPSATAQAAGGVSAKSSAAAVAPQAQAPVAGASVAGSPEKAQLQGELSSLEQELTGLQKMIAQQDAQIADLKRQIAARDTAQRDEQRRSVPASDASASDDQAAVAAAAAAKSTAALAHADQGGDSPYQDEAGRAIGYSNEPQSLTASAVAESQPETSESQHRAPESPPSRTAAPSSDQASDNTSASHRGAGLGARYGVKNSAYYWLAGIVSLAALMVWVLFYIRRRMEDSNPDVHLRYPIGPTFERDTEAPEARAALSETLPMMRSPGSGGAAAKLSAALKRRGPDETSDTESEQEEAAEEPQGGLDTWRTQTALLEQDILSETDVLPFVLDTQNQMKTVDEELLSPAELTHESREIVSDRDFARDLREEDFADTATSIPTEQLPGMVPEDIEELAAREQAELEQAARDVRRDVGAKDAPAKDAASKDSTAKEVATKDASAKDAMPKDTNAKDTNANDVTLRLASRPPEAHDDSLSENVDELPVERSATHQDIVKALESSLDYQPDRVDIQLKLLEIYHHEALGNRENFHSMLRKLSDRHNLSPAQRLHVEMLQRTLQDRDSSFVAEEET